MGVLTEFRETSRGLLRLLYPPLCPGCETIFDDSPERPLCPVCERNIEIVTGDVCDHCGHPLSEGNPSREGYCGFCPMKPIHFDAARAGVVYETGIRALIHHFKFHFQTRLAPYLTRILSQGYRRHFQGKADLLIPVPLHWWRRRWREFNQAELLARGLGAEASLPILPHGLTRARHTTPQSRIRGGRKRANVAGAFRVKDPRFIQGRRILLVDDVMTSGATANECSRVLREAGAEKVYVLTVARVVR